MIVQGSPEWFDARLGKLTASRIADALARTKSGWGASRANYLAELVTERLTGVPAESFTTPAMQRGSDLEADARAAYEFQKDLDVEPVGFVPHPTIGDAGASPDGLVGEDGLVEFKCPNTSTHLQTLLGEPVAAKYVKQMQWQMACTGRAWCDFASFDPRLPEPMQLFIQRFDRDDKLIREMEAEAVEFLAEVRDKVSALRSRYRMQEPLPADGKLLLAG
jgi:putative phage-type endonuclease